MKRLQRGFTLVEMLVALSIAGLLVSLVYGAVRVGQRSADALGTHTEAAEVMRIGWQYLHNALARARPMLDPDLPDNRTGFHGTRDRLQFIANMPAHVGIGGPMRITLSAQTGDDGYQLVLTRSRPDPSRTSDGVDADQQAILVEHLDRLNISYFGRQEGSATPVWLDSWRNPRTLPNLIRVSVEPTATPAWPVLIASPMTGTAKLGEIEPSSEPDPAADDAREEAEQ